MTYQSCLCMAGGILDLALIYKNVCICMYQAVPTWRETKRDFKVFSKREGTLPMQEASDPIDIRNVLNRDGSVISVVSPQALANPDVLYRDLGCKVRQCMYRMCCPRK